MGIAGAYVMKSSGRLSAPLACVHFPGSDGLCDIRTAHDIDCIWPHCVLVFKHPTCTSYLIDVFDVRSHNHEHLYFTRSLNPLNDS